VCVSESLYVAHFVMYYNVCENSFDRFLGIVYSIECMSMVLLIAV
jgi:hypothetical protein